MAIPTLKVVEMNTAPPIALTCKRGSGSTATAINVSGCTVDLIITKAGVQTNAGHTTCSITTAASGIVSYGLHSTDLPTAGTYICDLKVTYGDATVEVLYQQLKIVARKGVLNTA